MPIDKLTPKGSPSKPSITNDTSEVRDTSPKWTIPARKYALMQRDPLVNAFEKKFKEWLMDKSNSNLLDELNELERQVKEKWQEKIYIPETTHQGVTDFWLPVSKRIHQAVEDARLRGGVAFERLGEHSFRPISFGFDRNGLIFCPSHKIPVFIDPTLLTLNDIRSVKEMVWEIVEPEIRKLRDKKGYLVEPDGEPKELARVFHCLSNTFDNYLRCYDQWMRGLSFRLITYVRMKLTDPKKREELFDKYAKAEKRSQTITSSMPDNLARSIASKENAVRKGVNIIYFAIHRNKRVSRTPTTKLTQSRGKYNCPHHPKVKGEPKCPPDCPYLIAFEQDFEEDMPLKSEQFFQRESLEILRTYNDDNAENPNSIESWLKRLT